MLSSWFGQKTLDEPSADRPRRSFDLLRTTSISTTNDNNPPRLSLDNARPTRQSQQTYSTPHDDILAVFQSAPHADTKARSDDVGEVEEEQQQKQLPSPSLEPNASHSRIELGLSPAPSARTNATTANVRYVGHHPHLNPHAQTQTVDPLLDPFDGTSHGILLPHDANIIGQDEYPFTSKFNPSSAAEAGEAVWTNLSRVLDLQSQIAKMHAEMEGVGIGDGKKGKAANTARRGTRLSEDRKMYHTGLRPRMRAMSNVSTVGSEDEREGDEEGVSVADEEAEKTRAREEEFAQLADQFEGKKESIREIMNKLDDLSKALTEFHALQAPNIELSNSRHPSMGTAAPLPAPPPTHTQPPVNTNVEKPPLPHMSLPNSLYPSPRLTQPLSSNTSASTPFLPQSLSRLTPAQPQPHKRIIPTLIINSMESEVQPHVMDSPASTLGSLKLSPEE